MHRLKILMSVACLLSSVNAGAVGGAPIDASLIVDTSEINAVLNPIVKTAGIFSDHRPYEPATPLGYQVGLDLSAEVTLVKLPEDLLALQGGGSSQDSEQMPMPALKLHLHKGLGESVDLGLSFMALLGNRMIGGGIKVVLVNPEEGPTWAFRVNYSTAHLKYELVNIDTQTITPQLLISRRLPFADPYLGVGYQFVYGSATVDLPEPFPDILLGRTMARSFMAFTGVGLRIPRLGLKFTLEGAYSSVGMHSLGTKIGFNF
jgi:hypothetical protein